VRSSHRETGPTVGLFGLLGSGNLGNDASLEAMLEFLRTRHPDARTVAMCAGPKRVQERYGIPSIPLNWYDTQVGRPGAALRKVVGKAYDAFRTAAFVRRCDVVVVPGMGVLETTLPVRPWGWPYALFAMAAFAHLFSAKVALVGVGANDITSPATRRLVAAAARLATYRSYRDEYSKAALSRMGVDTASDEVHPDIAFALPQPPETTPVPGSVGVGVMAYYGAEEDRSRADEIHAAYLAGLTEFVRWLVDGGRTVRLVVGDAVDDEVVRAVLDDVRRTRPALAEDIVVAEPADDLGELMGRLGAVETVVASRYHNVLAALKLGKPTLSLGYGAKSDALMARMGLTEFTQSVRALDVALLTKQFARLDDEREALFDTLRERNAACRRELDRAFDRLSAALFPERAQRGPASD
jgi:polysaccharide pyruvyl transferase WcaK-like protein